MANKEHLAILRQGVEVWNEWRNENPDLFPDLSYIDLRYINFSNANLSNANLRCTNFGDADLRAANLCKADLRSASFCYANLKLANLNSADLRSANLSSANLSYTNLTSVNLTSANLSYTNLTSANLKFSYLNSANLNCAKLVSADLTSAKLDYADLRAADFSNADLQFANLRASQVLNANFSEAKLTGACIADWQISSSTKLNNISCDYIFRAFNIKNFDFCGRLPVDPNNIFTLSEFEQWAKVRESALETIDLTFTKGIDWKAFFASFQELRSQYPNDNISIQGLERKAEGFIVRLEVNQKADKAAIETQAKQLYGNQLQLLETQYRQQIHAKDREIEIYKQQSTDLLELAKLAASRPITVEAIATVNNNEGPKYNLQGAQFAGGFAETVEGDQIGGVINNYGASLDEITRLITALREQVQTFPPEQKDNALDLIDDIETDLKKPEPDPGRLGRKLKQLAAAGTAAATIASGAAAFSGNLNDFTANVLDLTNTLGVPIELVQPSQGTP